jgi:Ca-activated chloride channel homolog
MKRKIFAQVIVIGLMFVAACSGGGGGSSSPQSPIATPSPEISAQTALDHSVAVLGGSSSRQLSIKNIGTASLDIGQVALEQINSAFSVTSDSCSWKRLAPSDSCTLVTKLSPADQTDYSNFLIIPSSDTIRNPLRVNLCGKGRAYSANINEVKTDGCSNDPKVLKILTSVTNHTGVSIDTLAASNFTIFENGVQKTISNLTHPIVNTPVSVALLLDYSGSVSSSDRAAMEAAAKSFVALLQPNVDEASIIKFALTIGAKTPFTSDQSVLNASIDAPYPGNTGGTILYEAVFAAIDDTSDGSNNRRAIIVLSDGYDEESTITLDTVIARSIEKGIPVFTITYMNSSTPKPEIMQQLAQATGGEAFVALTNADMQGIYSKISTILSHQYLIEYETSSTGGAPVSVNIKIDDNSSFGENTKFATGCP